MGKVIKALIVEDSAVTRQLIIYALRGIEGIEVVEAADGIDGYRKGTSQDFNIIFVDINMPLMDGFTLIKKLRENASTSKVPIVVISIEGAKEDQERAKQLGTNAYLSKPVRAPEITSIVKDLLGEK